jgi:hypothetical protein
MQLTEEGSLQMEPEGEEALPPLTQQPSGSRTGTAQSAAAEGMAVAAPDQQQHSLQQQLSKPSDKLYTADREDIKQKSADLSKKITSLLQELLLAITEQLQGHSTALLASLVSACGPQVAAAAAAPHNSATSSAAAVEAAVEAAAKAAAMEQLAAPAAQLVLGPLLAEMANLDG